MDQDLESFLISRNVSEDNLQRMKMDEIDRAVLNVMTDEEMAKYIPSYGSRLAVRSFCRIKETDGPTTTSIQRLRQKIAEGRICKRKGSAAKSSSEPKDDLMARHKNTNAIRSKRRIEVGWLHYQNHCFHQVRSKNGGGTRHLVLEKSTSVKQMMVMAKNLFFPEGKSPKGPIEDFTYEICDFKKQPVATTSTIADLYEQSKLKMVRLYLCTRPFVHSITESDTSATENHEQVKGPNPMHDPEADKEDEAESSPQSSTPDVSLRFSSPVQLHHDASPVHSIADTEGLPAMPSYQVHNISYSFEVPAMLLDPNENEVFVLQSEWRGQEISNDADETLPVMRMFVSFRFFAFLCVVFFSFSFLVKDNSAFIQESKSG
ncbi:uncharacterized protein LOC143138252 [Alosa pseudoharengus]|uniref:uncharacterized protein LOC143138252 n=1 Tax=Alosa pseudoharengus TaxID=34774 RepID=UPI003F8C33C6